MFVFLAGRKDGDATRRRILDAVRKNPSINRNELADILGVHWNAIRYQVKQLDDDGHIHLEEVGWEKELFLPSVPLEHRRLISTLRDPDRSLIFDAILNQPGISSTDLQRQLEWGKKRTLTHLTHLQEHGLVAKRGLHRPRYHALPLPLDLDGLNRDLGHEP
jgi:predicted transcriptional regulator